MVLTKDSLVPGVCFAVKQITRKKQSFTTSNKKIFVSVDIFYHADGEMFQGVMAGRSYPGNLMYL
jgi:hypothetical protein